MRLEWKEVLYDPYRDITYLVKWSDPFQRWIIGRHPNSNWYYLPYNWEPI